MVRGATLWRGLNEGEPHPSPPLRGRVFRGYRPSPQGFVFQRSLQRRALSPSNRFINFDGFGEAQTCPLAGSEVRIGSPIGFPSRYGRGKMR